MAVVYQGAVGQLSGTPSLITYTNKMSLIGDFVPSANFQDKAPPIPLLGEDVGYANGIYTCPVQGTYSVGASVSVSGTLAVNSSVVMSISVSTDGGATWTNYRTTGQGPTTGLGKTYGYVPFLVPAPKGAKIRIMASAQNLLFPVISSSLDENTLSITKIF